MNIKEKLYNQNSKKEIKKIQSIVQKVLDLEKDIQKLSDNEIKKYSLSLKSRLKDESLDDILPEAFALCREASFRTIGLKPYPTQIMGGIELHKGNIAEMATGEGKTLVATLPAYLNSLTEEGVHIVTVNDYLAKRDYEKMSKVFNFLGVTCGLIISSTKHGDRKEAYSSNITYTTNNELGFDYLRDNMVKDINDRVQRKPNFIILDEVDSLLIDEARTPLIISGSGDDISQTCIEVDKIISTLTPSIIKEIDASEDNDVLYQGDYIVDEKAKSANLTRWGIKKIEKYFNINNLMDSENISLLNYINQAIYAYGVMKKDLNYLIKNGEVFIIDEYTGRIMDGRRFNNGLHQAIEAKEKVEIKPENKTLATITYQNYFRLYKKLSGMTGTALTEANEFEEIYNLNVIIIPTYKPNIRQDFDDIVFQTKKEKFDAVVDTVVEANKTGRPVLIGTTSVEDSELVSDLLKQRNIKHNVLNAKNNELEAHIIAQAGKKYAVTVSTNMAGRGTDIMLGGNAELLAKEKTIKDDLSDYQYLNNQITDILESFNIEELFDMNLDKFDAFYKETSLPHDFYDIGIKFLNSYKENLELYKAKCKEEHEEIVRLGGLCVIGTEKNESRRIDNQLRGRAGRQGDPGSTVFCLSLEDDLLRLFGGHKVDKIIDVFNNKKSTDFKNRTFTIIVENAQKTVESNNYKKRKDTVEYDDVVNRERTVIYKQRNEILDNNKFDFIYKKSLDIIYSTLKEDLKRYCYDNNVSNWDLNFIKQKYPMLFPDDFNCINELGKYEKNITFDSFLDFLYDGSRRIIDTKIDYIGKENYVNTVKSIILNNVDDLWIENINTLDEIKQGIHLQAMAQHDPLVEYRRKASEIYNESLFYMQSSITISILLFDIIISE